MGLGRFGTRRIRSAVASFRGRFCSGHFGTRSVVLTTYKIRNFFPETCLFKQTKFAQTFCVA